MKIELKKINQPDGKIWYGVAVDGYFSNLHRTLEEAHKEYDKTVEIQKLGLPPQETILSTQI